MHTDLGPKADHPIDDSARSQAGRTNIYGLAGLVNDLRSTRTLMFREGFAGALRRVLNTLRLRLYSGHTERSWERRFRLGATRPVPLSELTIFGHNRDLGVEYVSTPARVLTDLIKATGIDPRGYSFVDFGSGEGRTLVRAAEIGFRRVYGIEFASELHSAAERNITAFRTASGVATPIQALHADAATFALPGGPCVLYLFNPFAAPVLDQVIRNLHDSALRDPRHMVVVYVNPVGRSLFERSSLLRPMHIPARHRLKSAVFHTEAVRFYETDADRPWDSRAAEDGRKRGQDRIAFSTRVGDAAFAAWRRLPKRWKRRVSRG